MIGTQPIAMKFQTQESFSFSTATKCAWANAQPMTNALSNAKFREIPPLPDEMRQTSAFQYDQKHDIISK
jgi:hypothetical protein